MACQHRGHGGVEGLDAEADGVGQPGLYGLVDLVRRHRAGFLVREVGAAPDPGEGDHLHWAGPRGDHVCLKGVARVDVADVQRAKNLQGACPACDEGHVVIADQQEYRHARRRQSRHSLGELSLVRLRGVAALVCVAAEQGQVGLAVDCVVDDLVEGGEEVDKAARQPCLRVGLAVVFDADMYVGKVDYAHILLASGDG